MNISDKVEPELDSLLPPPRCLLENTYDTDIISDFFVGNVERPASSKTVSQLNHNMISKSNEFGLQREKYLLEITALTIIHGLRSYSVESPEPVYLPKFLLLSF